MPIPVKPSAYLEWIPSGNPSYIQQPSAGQAATGWVELEAPPFEYMNYLTYLTDQWIKWLDYATGAGTVNATALSTVGDIVIGSNVLQNLGSVTGILRGQTLAGIGFDPNTIVLTLTGTSVIMSRPATATLVANPVDFNHTYVTAVSIQTAVDELDSLAYSSRPQATTIDPTTDSPYVLSSELFPTGDCQKLFLVKSSLAAMVFNLPDPAVAFTKQFQFTIKDSELLSSVNTITLTRFGTEKIDAKAANYVGSLSGGQWTISTDGTDWFIDVTPTIVTKNVNRASQNVLSGTTLFNPMLEVLTGQTIDVKSGGFLLSVNNLTIDSGGLVIIETGGLGRVL